MTATSEPGHADDWADTGPIPLAPATHTGAGAGNVSQPTGDADKAREARYAEAIRREDAWALFYPIARAVMAVADAEVEAATRELRADRDSWEESSANWQQLHNNMAARWGAAEAERDQLRAACTCGAVKRDA